MLVNLCKLSLYNYGVPQGPEMEPVKEFVYF